VYKTTKLSRESKWQNGVPIITNVISRDAAAALMCKLGWRTVLVQSSARANVPIDLHTETANIIHKVISNNNNSNNSEFI